MSLLIQSLIVVLLINSLILQSVKAVRGNDEFDNSSTSTSTTSIRDSLQSSLLNSLPMPLINNQIVSFAVERAKSKSGNSSIKKESLVAAIQIQFENMLLNFKPDIQSSLRSKALENDWINYSSRGEHTFDSRPLGEVQINSIDNFSLTMDQRFKKLPILTYLTKLINLTQIIGPQITIMKENSLPYFQQTYALQNSLSSISGYWALSNWIGLIDVNKVLAEEIKLSSLQLQEIKLSLEYLAEFHNVDNIEGLNRYIKAHYPMAFLDKKVKEFLNIWLNQSLQYSLASMITKENTLKKSSIIPNESTTNNVVQFHFGKSKGKVNCINLLENKD